MAYALYSVILIGFVYPPVKRGVLSTPRCARLLYIAGLSQSVATVAITTTLGAAAGCISATAIGYGMKQYIDPGYVMNGVLAGLVSITSPCAV